MTISWLGDSALLLDFTDESADTETLLGRSLSSAAALKHVQIEGLVEVTSAYQSVALFLDLSQFDIPPDISLTSYLQKKISEISSARGKTEIAQRTVEIPVCYDLEFALDAERVATETKLAFATVVDLHSSAEFTVACIGFMPGFPYLAGLPRSLCVPRLPAPRTKVPAGSVAIANNQAGIYSSDSPGGWNIIGRTPLRMFDPQRDPPVRLLAGERVCFRQISRQQFAALSGANGN